MQIYWTKIKHIVDETNEIKTYHLEIPEDFTWEEGAFTHLGLKGFNEGDKPNRGLVRHLSISTVLNEDTIGITTRIKEDCSLFKSTLRNHQVGDEVALFKIHCNVPLRREDKNVYLFSAGVGSATFRPIVLQYLQDQSNVKQLHSLNIDSSQKYIFTDVFKTDEEKNLTAEFIDERPKYYDRVKDLATDKDGIYYVVGSDEFLKENITCLLDAGIQQENIMLDKREDELPEFFPLREHA